MDLHDDFITPTVHTTDCDGVSLSYCYYYFSFSMYGLFVALLTEFCFPNKNYKSSYGLG